MRVAFVALATFLIAFAAENARAQPDGVNVDPDSPAGVEYAVPLDAGRREGAPEGRSGPGEAGRSAFGVGLTPRPAGARGSGAGESARAAVPRRADSRESRTAEDNAGSKLDRTARAAAAVSSTEGGFSAGLATAAIALGVLLVGGIVAVMMRALRHSS